MGGYKKVNHLSRGFVSFPEPAGDRKGAPPPAVGLVNEFRSPDNPKLLPDRCRPDSLLSSVPCSSPFNTCFLLCLSRFNR